MILDSLDKIKCCGCSACQQACPKSAIEMIHDQDGFLYPRVNRDCCSNCGLCDKSCPILNSEKAKNSEFQNAYAAINQDKTILKKSSSGGVFSAIAQYVLSQNGIVCGAAFNEDNSVSHLIIDKIEDLEKLRGSKYLFSENAGTYSIVRDFLKNGRIVYFTGTGCQVAGLKTFLKKDYDNLITSDILCHGTPSFKMFKAFVNRYENSEHKHILKYFFRDKTICGWSCTSSALSYDKNPEHAKYIPFHPIFNAYFNAFISGSVNRESCYQCEFTTERRCGDITLADYWGVEKYHSKMDSLDGVSFILVNNEKGRFIFDKIKDNLQFEKTNPDWVAIINHNLREQTPRPPQRDSIYKKLAENPNELVDSFIVKDFGKARFKFWIKRLLRVNEKLYRKLYKIKRGVKQ